MARTDNLKDFLTDVADAIRTKKGTTELIPANTFDTEIESISGGKEEQSKSVTITENGTQTVTPDENKTLSSVEITTNVTAQAVYSPRYISFYLYNGIDLDEEVSLLNTSNITDMNYMFNSCTKLTSLNLSTFNTSNVTDMGSMFGNCSAKTLDLSGFDTSKVTDMYNMFGSSSATEIKGLSNFDTSNVTNMSNMFFNSKIATLDVSNFDTSNVTNMQYMFGNSSVEEITGLENFNFSKVTNLSSFLYNSKLQEIDLSGKDFPLITAMNNIFTHCAYLKTLNLSNTSWSKLTSWGNTSFLVSNPALTTIAINNAQFPLMTTFPPFNQGINLENINLTGMTTGVLTSMNQAFSGLSKLKELDLSGFDTSNVTTFQNLCAGCNALSTINLEGITTPKCTNMYRAFDGCKSLINLDLNLCETQLVTDIRFMFRNCSSLQNLDIRNFDFTNITSYTDMFSGIPSDCKIIVKDDTAKEWITSKFTNLTNVVTVAELGTE